MSIDCLVDFSPSRFVKRSSDLGNSYPFSPVSRNRKPRNPSKR
ncbi:hypothetical protein LEP1GSC052_1795 [Leptospira kmetyi serovar Malaysia str. Bejo-Iso9]|nr:hypothetical protein LEP1GSC052_1795 [Leptospira kmetyi serovar Malaysia str. Bejo-Iso9]